MTKIPIKISPVKVLSRTINSFKVDRKKSYVVKLILNWSWSARSCLVSNGCVFRQWWAKGLGTTQQNPNSPQISSCSIQAKDRDAKECPADQQCEYDAQKWFCRNAKYTVLVYCCVVNRRKRACDKHQTQVRINIENTTANSRLAFAISFNLCNAQTQVSEACRLRHLERALQRRMRTSWSSGFCFRKQSNTEGQFRKELVWMCALIGRIPSYI